MQLKSAAKLSSLIGLTTKYANCRMNAKQSPCKVTNDQWVFTAFAQRPLCALCSPAELLLRCRRPYCTAMATLRRPHCALIRTPCDRRATAFVLSMFKVRAVARHLCDATASSGDATALLRRCLRSYCPHLGVLHFSRTPWDRHENAALV